jgi:hypothetical protein
MAVCALCNYLRVSSDSYLSLTVDREDIDSGAVQTGDWRSNSVQVQVLVLSPPLSFSLLRRLGRTIRLLRFVNGNNLGNWELHMCS